MHLILQSKYSTPPPLVVNRFNQILSEFNKYITYFAQVEAAPRARRDPAARHIDKKLPSKYKARANPTRNIDKKPPQTT